jgi:hypothetical protein
VHLTLGEKQPRNYVMAILGENSRKVVHIVKQLNRPRVELLTYAWFVLSRMEMETLPRGCREQSLEVEGEAPAPLHQFLKSEGPLGKALFDRWCL